MPSLKPKKNDGADIRSILTEASKVLEVGPEVEIDNLARRIAHNCSHKQTVETVVSILALDDWVSMRILACKILACCSKHNASLLATAQWLATDSDDTVTNAALNALGRWVGLGNDIYALCSKLIRSSFGDSRTAGILILSHSKPESGAVDLLLPALKDEDWEVRQAAAVALGQLGDRKAINSLLEATKDDDPDVRSSVAEALGKMSDRRAIDVLLTNLKDQESNVREGAVRSLGELGDSVAFEEILKMLKDEDWDVRRAAAVALGKLGDRRAFDVLMDAVKVDYLRADAITALAKLRDRRLTDLFLSETKHEDSSVRQAAIEALEQIDDPRVFEAVLKAMNDEDWEVRQAAALALGRSGIPRALDPLVKSLQDDDLDVRNAAVTALSNVKYVGVLDSLLENLQHQDVETRLAALQVFKQRPNPKAIQGLLRALTDVDWRIRRDAASALAHFKEGRVLEALFERLWDDDLDVRESAASALSMAGTGDLGIFSRIAEIALSGDQQDRRIACLALKGMVATSPERSLQIAVQNLSLPHLSPTNRQVMQEIVGRCAFLNSPAAFSVIEEWTHSKDNFDKIAAAGLLGELIFLKKKKPLENLLALARDEEWTVREAAAAPLARRSRFSAELVEEPLRKLAQDEEIAIVFAASAALTVLRPNESLYDQPRLRGYVRSKRRSRFISRWLTVAREERKSGFSPYPLARRRLHQRLMRDFLLQPGLLRDTEEDESAVMRPRRKGEQSVRRRREINRKELESLFKELEQFDLTNPSSLEHLDRLVQLLPEPFLFYVLYKQARSDVGNAVCCLFYEMASLVEKIESSDLYRGRRESRLRRQLPTMLDRLARGFFDLRAQFANAQGYASVFQSLRNLVTASSLSEILTSLTYSQKALSPTSSEKRGARRALDVKSLINYLAQSMAPLHQYSEDAPISLRTVPLSETISHLEEAARIISLEGFEPHRTILLQVVSNWRELLREEIRRIEGQARLEFSTIQEITPGQTNTVVLQIANKGTAPATTLTIQLLSGSLADVKPRAHSVPSLAPGETTTVVFTARTIRSDLESFIVEFAVNYDDLLSKDNEVRHTTQVSVRTATHEWSYIRNPYLPGKPDPDFKEVERLFVGRQDVIRFLESNLIGSVAERIVVLYGQRRTGKTWTLLRLQERLPAVYLPVYINVQEFVGLRGVPAVLQIFADQILVTLESRPELGKTVVSNIHTPSRQDYEENYAYHFKRNFLRQVQAVLGERKLLWMFDEFQGLDDMVTSGNLPATFMDFLRDLMQFGKKMAFIFAGTREMSGRYWSVFFNIAVHQKIGVLNDADAATLILEPVKQLGVHHDRYAVPLIKQLTGNHPYFIQLLCDRIVYELNLRKTMLINAQIIDFAAEDLVINGVSNLKFFWAEVMDEPERVIAGTLQEVLRRKETGDVRTVWSQINITNPRVTSSDISNAFKKLAEKDLIEKDKTSLDTYRFKIGLLERYIGAHVPYAETQERTGKLL